MGSIAASHTAFFGGWVRGRGRAASAAKRPIPRRDAAALPSLPPWHPFFSLLFARSRSLYFAASGQSDRRGDSMKLVSFPPIVSVNGEKGGLLAGLEPCVVYCSMQSANFVEVIETII